jgi:tetratricopeptide (TPR) repeat protein
LADPYGTPIDSARILSQAFDPVKHVVPLMERSEVGRLTWSESLVMSEMKKNFESAIVYVQRGRHDEAIPHLMRTEDLLRTAGDETEDISSYAISMTLGDCYLKTERLQEARERYETALNDNPQSAEACYGLGLCFQQAGLADAARQMFEAALSLNPVWEQARLKTLECAELMSQESEG